MLAIANGIKMTTERDQLLEKLEEISVGSQRSKIARLREIFDGIEAARAKHTPNKAIVAGLEELGLIYDVNTFKNACSRIRKERALSALEQVASTSRSSSAVNRARTSTSPGSRKQLDQTPDNTQAESKAVGGSRPSILKPSKGPFGGLKPGPAE